MPKNADTPLHERIKLHSAYTQKMLGQPNPDDYFGKLFSVKNNLVRREGRGGKILDMGCGPGAHLLPLLSDGFDVAGLDFSENHLTSLRNTWLQRGGDPDRLRTICADIENVPEQDESYDLIFSFSTLYMLPNLDGALREISRLLRPGAKAIFELGNSRSIGNIESRRVGTGALCYCLPPSSMRTKIRTAGLSLDEEHCFQIVPLYGGANRTDQWLNQRLKQLLSTVGPDERLLDEVIASTEMLKAFAFRYLMVVSKPGKKSRVDRPISPDAVSKEVLKPRSASYNSFKLAAAEAPNEDLVNLINSFLCDPDDVAPVFAIAELFTADEERLFVERAKKIYRRLTNKSRHQSNILVDAQVNMSKGPSSISFKGDLRAHRGLCVSVVLPTFNHLDFLPSAVESILQQTLIDFELIIVNDGSTDATQTYLETINDPRVKVFHIPNGGLPAALNFGFTQATGTYRTWTSADNVVAPAWLERLSQALDRAPVGVGLVCSAYAEIDAENIIIGFRRGQMLQYDRLAASNVGIASFMYRSSVALQVGEYDVTLNGAEDWDMWLRILDVCDATYLDDVLYFYRLHGNSMTSTMQSKIKEASAGVLAKLHRRHGDRLDLNRFYPQLRLAEDRRLATWQAKQRLAGFLLESPFCPAPWPATLLLEALQERFSADAFHHLVMLLCRCKAWDMASQAIRDFGSHLDATAVEALHQRVSVHDLSIIDAWPIIHKAPEELAFELGHGLVTACKNPLAASGYSFCIITNGKRPAKLHREIDSIEALNIPIFEILVGGELPMGFERPNVRSFALHDAARHGRLGEMRNHLCREAQYPTLIVADDDMVFHADFLTGIQNYGKPFDVLCPRLLNPDGTRFWDWSTHGGPTGHHLLRYEETDPHVYVTGGLCVMRAAVFAKVQWDQGLGFYQGEDVDFSERVKASGFSIEFCMGSTATHDDPRYTQVGREVHRCLSTSAKPIVLDISVLIFGFVSERARTGIHRYVDNLLRKLTHQADIELHLGIDFDIAGMQEAASKFLQARPDIAKKFPVENIKNVAQGQLLHSPFFRLPVTKSQGPRVLTVHDLIPIKFPHFFEFSEGDTLRSTIGSLSHHDFFICNSQATKADLLAFAPKIPEDHVFVTPLAADRTVFFPCLDKSEKARVFSKYKLNDDKNYLLSVATLEPRKNLAHMIRAFVRLLQEGKIEDLNLVLVGAKGWLVNEIFDEISMAGGIRDRIILTGFVPDEDMAPLYSNAMAFSYLSLYEGFGLPPLEAMQCGTPVITSDNSSLPEVVGDCGIMVRADDEAALVDAIRLLYTDTRLRDALSEKGLARAASFSWERCADQTVAAYEVAYDHWQSKKSTDLRTAHEPQG